VYIELSPVFYAGAITTIQQQTYNAEFLLRLGLTDRFDFASSPAASPGRRRASAWHKRPALGVRELGVWNRQERARIDVSGGSRQFLLSRTGPPIGRSRRIGR
jgi:hypothetical protein